MSFSIERYPAHRQTISLLLLAVILRLLVIPLLAALLLVVKLADFFRERRAALSGKIRLIPAND